ncbi:alpha-amylase [Aspergillus homomorphus CBS 101889]|uniref:alpha-amylase n=1 Tax=Aspergillus homomorphus (strain CBS 101889) TaxID=1450537 RepID=A0A395I7B2_ASPHC|nr:amylase A,Taka [Aspergillus homomorphus CBS 101889]RAL16102.1 amylase A,Taka [Aspergillus homomorphus CBS 101889]
MKVQRKKYCGGSWRGIINQLDYIQGMGFSAIWITPVTAQVPQGSGIGSARGYDGAADSVDYSVFKPFNKKEYFHSYCSITNYDNQTNVQDCWLGDNKVSLPDLDTTRSDVQTMWYDWVKSLVSNYSIDGLRIDTVKHVQKEFWPGYNKAAGVYCIEEVCDGDTSYTCPYQKYLDGVLNYPMYFPLLRAFKSTSGSISDLYNMINTVKDNCPDSTLMGTFIENHDNPRFASYTKDLSLAKNVAAFSILADGIPIIYAGQEQHYSGGNDPSKREATWLSGYSTTSPLYTLIAEANKIRSHAIKQDAKYLMYKNYPIYKDTTTIAMRKGFNGAQIITVLSNLGSAGKSYTLSLTGTGYQAGLRVTEIFTCTTLTVNADGSVPVPMANGLPRALFPTAKLGGSSICG